MTTCCKLPKAKKSYFYKGIYENIAIAFTQLSLDFLRSRPVQCTYLRFSDPTNQIQSHTVWPIILNHDIHPAFTNHLDRSQRPANASLCVSTSHLWCDYVLYDKQIEGTQIQHQPGEFSTKSFNRLKNLRACATFLSETENNICSQLYISQIFRVHTQYKRRLQQI